jgi:hypothetical protein
MPEHSKKPQEKILTPEQAAAAEKKDPNKPPDPTPPPNIADEGSKGELKLKLRAKSRIVVEGVVINAGQEFELPERQALGLVGTGDCEQIPTKK